MSNPITSYMGLHADALPLREQRMKLIASNLANADTPGYRAQVAGTCGGVLSGNTFTTTAVTADCTVVVTFAVIPANPVPTLSQWALILMAALLALLAAGQLPLRNNRRP